MKKLFTLFLSAVSTLCLAQSPCDSLSIQVHYAAFNDSFIQVSVVNQSSQLFSYPQFTLLNSNGDTVAKEDLNFFGIGQSSIHTLQCYPGMPASSAFSGTLQLYYATIDSYAVCTWNANFNLCPDTCQMFYPSLVNLGGAQVLGNAHWEILNANAQIVTSGTFTLDTANQYSTDSACLSPGQYTMNVHNMTLTPGGQKHISITHNAYSTAPDTSFNGSTASLSFTLFEPCITPVSVKQGTVASEGISIYAAGKNIMLHSRNGQSLGKVVVRAVDGKVFYSESTAATGLQIALPYASPGVYIVHAAGESVAVKKIFLGE